MLAVLLATQSAFARPELLVDTAWLAAHLNDGDVRIVDLRPKGFGESHIPNAVWLDNNAIRIANRFIPKGSMVVYTRGRVPNSDADYRATEQGEYLTIPIVTLVNRNSASGIAIST